MITKRKLLAKIQRERAYWDDVLSRVSGKTQIYQNIGNDKDYITGCIEFDNYVVLHVDDPQLLGTLAEKRLINPTTPYDCGVQASANYYYLLLGGEAICKSSV